MIFLWTSWVLVWAECAVRVSNWLIRGTENRQGGAGNDKAAIKYRRLKSFLLYNVFTLGNLISDLTKLSFLLHWREQAWPLTCSVIKAKQTPSISCHYRAGAGRREGKGEREKKMVEGRKERRVECITRKGWNKGWRERRQWRRKDGSEGARRRGFGEGARKRKRNNLAKSGWEWRVVSRVITATTLTHPERGPWGAD